MWKFKSVFAGWSSALALAFLVHASPAVAAEDCPRGTLDERYCDRDGDEHAYEDQSAYCLRQLRHLLERILLGRF